MDIDALAVACWLSLDGFPAIGRNVGVQYAGPMLPYGVASAVVGYDLRRATR